MWFPAGSAPSNNRAVRLVAPAGKAKDMGDGVLPGIASWPPKPITEHGQPKPEDDPANFEGTNIVDLCAALLLVLSLRPACRTKHSHTSDTSASWRLDVGCGCRSLAVAS